MVLGYVYLRYTEKIYLANASLIVQDERKGGTGASELSAFEDLGLFNSSSNMENEMALLLSRPILRNVINSLQLNIETRLIGNVTGWNRPYIYGKEPFTFSSVQQDSVVPPRTAQFELTIIDNNSFELETAKDKIGVFNFGQVINLNAQNFVITSNESFKPQIIGNSYEVLIRPIDRTIDYYKGKLTVSNENNKSNILNLSIKDASKERAVDVLRELIKQYNIDAVQDQNKVSQNTANFINERMSLLIDELGNVEDGAAQYKTDFKLTDIVSETGIYLTSEAKTNQQIIEASTQLRLSEYMRDFLSKSSSIDQLMPANLGINDPSIQQLIEIYNQKVLERNKSIANSSIKNPVATNLENQLRELKSSLELSLERACQVAQIQFESIGNPGGKNF